MCAKGPKQRRYAIILVTLFTGIAILLTGIMFYTVHQTSFMDIARHSRSFFRTSEFVPGNSAKTVQPHLQQYKHAAAPLPKRKYGSQRVINDKDEWIDGSPVFQAVLREYTTRHQQAVSSRAPESSKYIVFVATNDGLGNKILPMVSCFLFALLINRTFLVDWTGRDPFDANADMWVRNPGAVSHFLHSPFNAEWRYEVVASRLHLLKSEEGWPLLDLRSPDYSDLKLEVLCGDLAAKHSNDRVLRITSEQYILPLIAANDRYRERVLTWLRPGNMYGPLARALLKPSPFVGQRIDATLNRFGNYTIGLQIRRQEGIGLRMEEVDRVWECARHLRLAYGPPGQSGVSVRFLVATDDIFMRETAESKLGRENVITFDHSPDRDSLQGVMWALAEVHLLAACDDIIATPHSTFGYMAHGFASTVPFRVGNEPDIHCFKDMNADPSAHLWNPLFDEQKIRPEVTESMCKQGDPAFFQMESPPRW